jgi:hypothetical protein
MEMMDDGVTVRSMFEGETHLPGQLGGVKMRVGMSGSSVRGSLDGERESGTAGRNGQIDVPGQCEGRLLGQLREVR